MLDAVPRTARCAALYVGAFKPDALPHALHCIAVPFGPFGTTSVWAENVAYAHLFWFSSYLHN